MKIPMAMALLATGLFVAPPARGFTLEHTRMLGQYTIASWIEDNGLPFSRIWSITQDAAGYMWLGTDVGLVRFDGVRFVRWAMLAGAPLRDAGVTQVLSARDGSLWVAFGDGGGIAHLQDGRVQQYDEDDGIAHGSMTFLTEDRDGQIWTGNRSGLYHLEKSVWRLVGSEFGLAGGAAYSAYDDAGGNLWVATNTGVYRRPRTSGAFVHVSSIGPQVRSFAEDVEGRLWIAWTAGVGRIDRTGAIESGLAVSGQQLLRDSDGSVWIGTVDRGLWRVTHKGSDGGVISEHLDVSTGLSSDEVRSLYEDRAGNVWVGTVAGLHRLTRRKVTPVTDIQGTRVVAAASDGSVWVATTSGLVEFADGVFRRYATGNTMGLFADKTGTLWAGRDNGVSRWRDGMFVDLPVSEGVHIERVTSFGMDSHGTLWLCDFDAGVFQWKDGRITPLSLPAPVETDNPIFVYVDRKDRKWIALKGGKLLMLDAAQGPVVLPIGNRNGQVFMSVYEDSRGAIWVGGSHGLTRIQGTSVETVTQQHGLPGYGVSAIIEDEAGDLWLGLGSGIAHLRPHDFDAVLAGASSTLHYDLHNVTDGLAGMPRRYGYPSAARAMDGRLWFITGSGLTVIDPRTIEHKAQPIALVIEHATADEELIDVRNTTALRPNVSRLVIDYTALNVTSPLKVRFRYWLEGVDHGWIDAEGRRTAAYTNLTAGSYRFHVTASSSESEWNEARQTWAFTVAPAFSETWWPYAIAAVALSAIVSVWWRWRLEQVRKQFAVVVAERTRISRELHDTLLQGMVGMTLQMDAAAHAGDLGTLNAKDAKAHFLHLRREAEAYIREARQAILQLRSTTLAQHDLGESIRAVGERLVAAGGARFEVSVHGGARRSMPQVEQQLLRIAQEAITNSVRHAHAANIQLRLAYEPHAILLRISDDGSGFDPSDPDESSQHYGLLSMRERAQQVGGDFKIETVPGSGTIVEVTIPAQYR